MNETRTAVAVKTKTIRQTMSVDNEPKTDLCGVVAHSRIMLQYDPVQRVITLDPFEDVAVG
jgi:hypothetical protein